MKKRYVIPEVQIVRMEASAIIAESIVVDGTQKVSTEKGGFVKGDTQTRQDYNVWDEDWSANK